MDDGVSAFDAELVVAEEVPSEGHRAAAGLFDAEVDLELVVELEGAVVDNFGGAAWVRAGVVAVSSERAE
jgi:hypothetical protein